MKLKLYATVDLGHNGSTNKGIWEVAYPIKQDNGTFKINTSIKNHPFYSIIKKSVVNDQKRGKCILLQSSGVGGYNCGINKDNASDFYFAESVNGKHIINIATETLIAEVKELLN